MNDEMIKQAEEALREKARQRAYADGKSGWLNLSELWPYYDEQMRKEDKELAARRMIISCICYGDGSGFYDEERQKWGDYGVKYAAELGDKRAREIFREQRDYMRKHATINTGVYTDHEGCTYNSISWN